MAVAKSDRDDISKEGKLILRCLDELKRDQAQRWVEQHDANTRIHERLDEMVKAQANNITKQDCKECKEKKRGVSPKMAFVGIPLASVILTSVLQKVHWDVIWKFVSGGGP